MDKNGKCIECEEDYEFDWNYNCVKIVEGPKEDHCEVYWYVNPRGKWYEHWVSGCEKVCAKCHKGYYLDSEYECV